MQTLFDKNGMLNITDIVSNHPSYTKIMEDGIVTDEELQAQTEATIASLRHLQEICTPEQQSAILNAISELSVLMAVYQNYQLQEIRK